MEEKKQVFYRVLKSSCCHTSTCQDYISQQPLFTQGDFLKSLCPLRESSTFLQKSGNVIPENSTLNFHPQVKHINLWEEVKECLAAPIWKTDRLNDNRKKKIPAGVRWATEEDKEDRGMFVRPGVPGFSWIQRGNGTNLICSSRKNTETVGVVMMFTFSGPVSVSVDHLWTKFEKCRYYSYYCYW